MATTSEIFKGLSSVLAHDEIEWRQQGKPNAKGNISVVPYINNRAVQNRLDEWVKPEYWKCEFFEWRTKGVKCRLSIKIDNEWVYKEDGADESDIEATKGGFSDAMKRCAVQWGIGRCLYDYPKVFCVAKDPNYGGIPDSAYDELKQLVYDFNEGLLVKPFYFIK